MSKTTKIVLIVIPIVMLLALAISFTVFMLRPEEDTPIDEPSGDKPINCIEDLSNRTYKKEDFDVNSVYVYEGTATTVRMYYAVINLGVDNEDFVPPTSEETYHLHFKLNGKELGILLNPANTDKQYTYDTLLYGEYGTNLNILVCDEAYVKDSENLFGELSVMTEDHPLISITPLEEGVQVDGYCIAFLSTEEIKEVKILSIKKYTE